MKPRLLAAALALFAAPTLFAATVTVTVGGNSTVYTLDSLSVDSGGNVTVRATQGDGTPNEPPPNNNYTLTISPPSNGTISGASSGTYSAGTTFALTATPAAGYSFAGWSGCTSVSGNVCNVTLNGNTTVAASFTPQQSSGGNACVESATLKCVNTPLPTAPFSQVKVNPDPAVVYAFKVVAPSSGAYSSSVTATVQSQSFSAKRLVISETPGDINRSNKPAGCSSQGSESSMVRFSINRPDLNTYIYCPLTPGKTYYINASSNKADDSGYTCTTTTNCGFYISGR